MRIRAFAAQALADAVAAYVQLGAIPTVIDAPPSQLSEYPAIAVWIEKADDNFTQPGTVLQDANGNALIGSAATDSSGNILDGDPIVLGSGGSGVTIQSIGTIRCTGRVWTGSRYPGKREELEEAIFFAFNQDEASRGRLLVQLTGCQLGQYTLPFGTAAADLNGSEWSGEHSFEARLWSWRPFTLDLPLLVPRTDPIATQLIVEITRDLAQTIAVPTDTAKLLDLEKWTHDANGNLVTTTT